MEKMEIEFKEVRRTIIVYEWECPLCLFDNEDVIEPDGEVVCENCCAKFKIPERGD